MARIGIIGHIDHAKTSLTAAITKVLSELTPAAHAGWNNDQAFKEGWGIFEASGSTQNVAGDREYQLQKDDEAGVFDDDVQAWRHVAECARTGSLYHRRALSFLKEESPGEFAAILLAVGEPA